VTFTFTGTGAALYAKKDSGLGKLNVQIDGGVATSVDCYSPTQLQRQKVFEVTGLPPGTHTLRATVAPKNPASASNFIGLDYFTFQPSPHIAGRRIRRSAIFFMSVFFAKRIVLWAGLLVMAGRVLGAPADPVVGRINDEPVTAGEYRLVLVREAPGVFSHLKATRDLDDHFGYWKEGGEPLAQLRAAVRDELVRIKVRQALARQRGLVHDTGFATFEREHAAENARRKAAVVAGEVIHGPTSYPAAAFYYVRFGELSFRVTDLLTKEAEPEITDGQVETIYQERRSEFGDKPLAEVRLPIRAYLAKRQAEEHLDTLCAAACVEFEESALRGLIPRKDAEDDLARQDR
jgi:hypothetical protein